MHPAELAELEAFRDLYAVVPASRWIVAQHRPRGLEPQYVRPNYLSSSDADTSGKRG